MHTMISDTYRSLALASLRRARNVNAPGRTRRVNPIVAHLDGDPTPLASTRVTFTLLHRRGPALDTRTLCPLCSSVAFAHASRVLAVNGVARRVSLAHLTMSVSHSGVACDACGRTDLPYGERLVHDPPDCLV